MIPDSSDVLIFTIKSDTPKEQVAFFTNKVGEFIEKNGYAIGIIDHDTKWNKETLSNILAAIEEMKVNNKMVKNSSKKVIILEARGLVGNDLALVGERILKALLDYDISIMLVDDHIRVEKDKAKNFYAKIKKLLGIRKQLDDEKVKEYLLKGEADGLENPKTDKDSAGKEK